MAINTDIQWLQQQLSATRDLLEASRDSELMRVSLEYRLKDIESEISRYASQTPVADAKISMWFSGDATFGSMGLRGSFMKETLNSIEGMVKSASLKRIRQFETEHHHRVKRPKGNFYVTALTKGSFGYEMTYKENGNLFDDLLIIDSISDVMSIIEQTSSASLDLDSLVEEQPVKLLSHLKDFYKTIKKNNSFLRMKSGNMGFELDKEQTTVGYENICSQDIKEQEEDIVGTFKGALIESGKFEFFDTNNKLMHGSISEELDVASITELVQRFTNKQCNMHLLKHVISNSNGNKRELIELLSISEFSGIKE